VLTTALNGVSAPYRIVPVEKIRGPSFAPVRTSSALVKTVAVSFDGSCEVVTPNATLAASGQLDFAIRPEDSPPRCPWTSMMPGIIVLPFTSTRVAPAGTCTAPDGPTATI
jgi:hypothetical protein